MGSGPQSSCGQRLASRVEVEVGQVFVAVVVVAAAVMEAVGERVLLRVEEVERVEEVLLLLLRVWVCVRA